MTRNLLNLFVSKMVELAPLLIETGSVLLIRILNSLCRMVLKINSKTSTLLDTTKLQLETKLKWLKKIYRNFLQLFSRPLLEIVLMKLNKEIQQNRAQFSFLHSFSLMKFLQCNLIISIKWQVCTPIS